MSAAPPERIELDDGIVVRWVTVDDAEAIARAVGESLEHLKPWMPWADAALGRRRVPARTAPRTDPRNAARRGMAVRDVRGPDDRSSARSD